MNNSKKLYLISILKDFFNAIPAGICISLGGIAFLSCENKVVGSLFFTLGLFLILLFDFNLFTGKVCFVVDKKINYVANLCSIWVGNLIGTLFMGSILNITRLSALTEKCISVCNVKLGDNLFSIFILAILCNVLIFIAVYGFKNFGSEIGKYLALFFGVSIFVLCGYEHCVANMFYFSFASVWSWKAILYLIVMTLGNALGGVLAYLVSVKLKKKY